MMAKPSMLQAFVIIMALHNLVSGHFSRSFRPLYICWNKCH